MAIFSLSEAIAFLTRVLKRLGVDRPLALAVATKVWMLAASPITFLLVASRLSENVQGFLYTFNSLLALQSFVELGLCIVIINLSSHEWAKLHFDDKGQIGGDPNAFSRLASLVRLVFKWYAVAAGIFAVGVSIIGYRFFSQSPYQDVRWQTPWLLLVGLTALLLWMLPFTSLLEGCNQLTPIYKSQLSQAVLSSLLVWFTLGVGGGLWAAVVALGVRVVLTAVLLIQYRQLFRLCFAVVDGPQVNWVSEIWPMQWRLGVSGLVNYFAFSLFTPVMFHYHGAAAAGRMGMSLAAVTGVQSVAGVWLQTKVPRFGVLIANREYAELDRLFWRSLFSSGLIICAGATALWILVSALYSLGHPLSERVLPPEPTVLFLLAAILMQVTQCQVTYLRAHKRDPIVVISVVSSLAIGLLVWVLGGRFGAHGAAAGYLGVVALFIVPSVTLTWFQCRAKWHG